HIGGPQAAKSALARIGVDPKGFRLADGSGLSRRNAATPKSLVTTLRVMYYAPGKDMFYASLPVAGRSGTLRNRMKNTPAQGTVLAKTGTLRGVRALSGYIKHPNFGMVLFSILANNPHQSGSSLVRSIDKIVLQISTIKPCN
ncbi:MAG TPA: peptidase S13, partial [Cyanothece sp. UBA12306]|nr:peptidase S13 [Cyanothece sp. UBA12306]